MFIAVNSRELSSQNDLITMLDSKKEPVLCILCKAIILLEVVIEIIAIPIIDLLTLAGCSLCLLIPHNAGPCIGRVVLIYAYLGSKFAEIANSIDNFCYKTFHCN